MSSPLLSTTGDLLRSASKKCLLPLSVLLLPLTSFVASAAEDGGVPPPPAEEGGRVPEFAPFSGPAPGRPLPPPSGLAGLGELDFGDSALERGALQLQSEAVVETATKRAQKLNEVPMTVSWIPGDELQGTGQFSLCDAVQYFPGMECRRGPMRKAAISARGLGSNFLSNRLLLLQDGRPQTDPWTGQFSADESMPLTNVKQIEVIRGPGSSLYGSNAFSGVINVIRRKPRDIIREGENYGVDARAMVGQNETLRLQATGAGRVGDVEALVNYYGHTTSGPQLFNDAERGIEDHNQWSNAQQVSGLVQWKSLSLDADFTSSGLGRPGGTQISTVGNCGRCHYTPDDSEHVQTLNANLQFDHKVADGLRVFGQTYAVFKRREVALESQLTDVGQTTLGKRNRVGAEGRALVTVGNLNLTLGGDVKNDTVNNLNILPQFDPEDMRQTVVGGFADAEYRVYENLIVGAGIRYDRYFIPREVWRNADAELSPRASIVFHAIPELVTLRTNYGRAFRAPTLSELAINQQMYASTLLGNPFLEAETLDTVEFAVDVWPAGGAVRVTGTGFYNNARNFINQEFTLGSSSRFANIGDARVVGFEIEAAAQVRAINSAFDVAYQFLDPKKVVDGEVVGPLDYAANHRLYLRGRTQLGKVGFAEVFAVVVGERYDPGFNVDPETGLPTTQVKMAPYLVANARVGANVTEDLSVSLLGSNIFNSSFQEVHGFPSAPLNVFLEAQFKY